MTKCRKIDLRLWLSVLLALLLATYAAVPAFADLKYASSLTTTAPAAEQKGEGAASAELNQLQEEYDALEAQIQEGEKGLREIEKGKDTQTQNIKAIQSNISNLDSQIDVLEKRIGVLDSDITTLNSSINVLNKEISTLNVDIYDTEDEIHETQRTADILFSKIRGRLIINYMSGTASNLEVILGVRDLPSFFTKLQIIRNLSAYDREILKQFEDELENLQNLNNVLSADKSALNEKQTAVTSQKTTLSDRQADIESSQYVLDLKKQLSEHKYKEAVAYRQSLDESSAEYAEVLKLLSKEQDKVDAEINAYLLKYGSSADAPENVTRASGDGTKTTSAATTAPYVMPTIGTGKNTLPSTTESGGAKTTITLPTTTNVSVVTPETIELIWPLPYKNCYISAYYGQYPSGGAHHGLDICVRGGTEGKNVVAAADGTVISYGFNHWSMGNYIIIDHGCGLFTAYYHMQRLYAEQGDRVKQGQVIGLAGHTGNTTGPHLHFEVRISRNGAITRVNPLKFVSMP